MRLAILCWFLIGCATALAPAARAGSPSTSPADGVIFVRETWHDAARDRDVPVKLDVPAAADKPLPVVLLSHGLGGSREGLATIGHDWAAHGFLVVHLQHAGSDESIWRDRPPAEALRAVRAAASPEQFAARVKDVTFALDELARRNADSDWPLHGRVDLSRVAMAGHSFGAVTTQAVCGQAFLGQRRSLDPRIKGGVVFSPGPPPGGDAAAARAFGHMPLPMFYCTGTEDAGPALVSQVKPASRRVPFDATTGADAYLLILAGGDHMLFNGRVRADPALHPRDADALALVGRGTTAFLDKVLRGDKAQAAYLDGGGFAADAKALGTFEAKHAE